MQNDKKRGKESYTYWEGKKLSSFTNELIIYVENLKESTISIQVSNYSKVAKHRFIYKNHLPIYDT